MKTKSMNLTVKTMGKEKNVFVGNRDKEDNRLSNRSNINGSIKDKCQSLAYPADNKYNQDHNKLTNLPSTLYLPEYDTPTPKNKLLQMRRDNAKRLKYLYHNYEYKLTQIVYEYEQKDQEMKNKYVAIIAEKEEYIRVLEGIIGSQTEEGREGGMEIHERIKINESKLVELYHKYCLKGEKGCSKEYTRHQQSLINSIANHSSSNYGQSRKEIAGFSTSSSKRYSSKHKLKPCGKPLSSALGISSESYKINHFWQSR